MLIRICCAVQVHGHHPPTTAEANVHPDPCGDGCHLDAGAASGLPSVLLLGHHDAARTQCLLHRLAWIHHRGLQEDVGHFWGSWVTVWLRCLELLCHAASVYSVCVQGFVEWVEWCSRSRMMQGLNLAWWRGPEEEDIYGCSGNGPDCSWCVGRGWRGRGVDGSGWLTLASPEGTIQQEGHSSLRLCYSKVVPLRDFPGGMFFFRVHPTYPWERIQRKCLERERIIGQRFIYITNDQYTLSLLFH